MDRSEIRNRSEIYVHVGSHINVLLVLNMMILPNTISRAFVPNRISFWTILSLSPISHQPLQISWFNSRQHWLNSIRFFDCFLTRSFKTFHSFFSANFKLHMLVKLKKKKYIKLPLKVTSFSILSYWKSTGGICRKPFGFIIKSLILTILLMRTRSKKSFISSKFSSLGFTLFWKKEFQCIFNIFQTITKAIIPYCWNPYWNSVLSFS